MLNANEENKLNWFKLKAKSGNIQAKRRKKTDKSQLIYTYTYMYIYVCVNEWKH